MDHRVSKYPRMDPLSSLELADMDLEVAEAWKGRNLGMDSLDTSYSAASYCKADGHELDVLLVAYFETVYFESAATMSVLVVCISLATGEREVALSSTQVS